ncbi:signal transduction histidine kinase [Mesorhizobium sangaii]|uniref:Signal transduction histidine kinase n=1 Tax=Mesorhizobium sangaii TaxID=505389 RepID=A0A841PSR3_9HYPH|nr:signal transduction histidine kinase [Mesorhizobium sangaii]
MPADKHKCHVETTTFGLRGDDEPRRLQRAKMRPEALYEVKLGLEAFGRAKARFSAKKQGAIAFSRQRNRLGLKGMKKRLQRLGGHCSISKRGLRKGGPKMKPRLKMKTGAT